MLYFSVHTDYAETTQFVHTQFNFALLCPLIHVNKTAFANFDRLVRLHTS